MPSAQLHRTWWKDGTVYQIWPASYKDSNGDGIGDIPGIISTLDHLQDLGIDIVWVSPVYDSPQQDMGYDVSNYEAIYPPYGTLADAESLIHACHDRGMRIIFDLVINHTSDQHAWFQQSRSSRSHPKRDWYIWRPARDDGDGKRKPPNNWRAHWGDGSAWEWDADTQEYYLHLFSPQQPDLNWENATTRAAIYASAVTFWLDRGIDGFRIDTVNMYSKRRDFPDAPIHDPTAAFQFEPSLFCNGPRMHEFLTELNTKILSRYDCMTVGELPHTHDTEEILSYVSAREQQLNMVFQFDVVDLGQRAGYKFEPHPFTLADFASRIGRMQRLTVDSDAWTTAFLENHDQARSISRFACDLPEYRVASGKLLALLLGTLTGTLFLYQGQEIGMINTPASWTAEDYRDVEAVRYLDLIRARFPGDDAALGWAVAGVRMVGRDNARTPVQWDGRAGAGVGFTEGRPWMRVCEEGVGGVDVAGQRGDEGSLLEYWKRVLRVRRGRGEVFVHGDFELVDDGGGGDGDGEVEGGVMRYWKRRRGGEGGEGGERVLVCLNFSGRRRGVFGGVEVGGRVVEIEEVSQKRGRTAEGKGKGKGDGEGSGMGERNSEAKWLLEPWEGKAFWVRD